MGDRGTVAGAEPVPVRRHASVFIQFIRSGLIAGVVGALLRFSGLTKPFEMSVADYALLGLLIAYWIWLFSVNLDVRKGLRAGLAVSTATLLTFILDAPGAGPFIFLTACALSLIIEDKSAL